MQTRRDFLGKMTCAGAAFAAYGLPKNMTTSFGQEKLRFGVISDVHITTEKQQAYFKQALERLDAMKVDAIVACGDLADFGMELQLQLVADTWFEVFPNNKSKTDGRDVVNLMHYGDHDMQDERYIDYDDAVKRWPDRAERLASVIHPTTATDEATFVARAKAAWERCFKCNDWSRIVIKDVKGYKFVLSHFTRGEATNKSGNNVPGLAEFLAAQSFDSSKPFFYSQHRIPKLTAAGETVYGQDDGTTTQIFSNYPNLVAFCGHAHENCVQENSIWQGAFTCLQVPSLRYTTSLAGCENSYATGSKATDPDGEKFCMTQQSGGSGQGYVCRVFEHAMVVKRCQLVKGKSLGPNWIIPFSSFEQPAGQRPYNFAVRAATEPAPEFSAGAAVTVGPTFVGKDRGYGSGESAVPSETHTMTPVKFPAAHSRWFSPRANDYEVAVEIKNGDEVSLGKVKYVYPSAFHYSEDEETKLSQCNFSEVQIPASGTYRFRVTPRNMWKRRGKPIYSAWITV